MSITPATHIYFGELPCGCIEVVCADIPEIKKETAKSVAEMIKNGYAVKRIPVEDWNSGMYKDRFQRCIHKNQKSKKNERQESLFVST
jgi:hypothetical protein